MQSSAAMTPQSPPAKSRILDVDGLSISFRIDRQTRIEAVRDVSFGVAGGSTVALVGESGSGKSVTAMSIVGLLPPNATLGSGSRISFDGRDLIGLPQAELRSLRGQDISVVFQEPMSSLNPVFTIGEQIAESLRLHLGMGARAARERAVELLDEVGIPRPQQRAQSYPHELSGGQQQRAMIAMAIACEPKLLIADEPTTALDVTIQRQILELLAGLQQRHGMAILFITHDLGLVGEIADHVVVMRGGRIREQGAVRDIFERPADPYTRALMACRPRLDRRPRRLPVIEDFLGDQAPAAVAERSRGLVAQDPVILDVRGLCKNFPVRTGLFRTEQVPAVRDVSFKLRKGKTLGLVGESGSGKTTVGLTLMRLHRASGGQALFEGRDLLALSEEEMKPYRRRIQIVFQNPYASLNPRFTVGHILLEPMRLHAIGADNDARIALAQQLLQRVGLPAESFDRYPHEFSGGQRQRIAIARCLTMRPDVLICDESVSALDVSVQAQVLNLLQDLQDEYQLSYIFISHDLAVVRYMSDEVIVMSEGQAVEIADADQIYRAPEHPYTRRLLESVPKGWTGEGAASEQAPPR
jgi:peptide/nickel transport system ATP-binding protein